MKPGPNPPAILLVEDDNLLRQAFRLLLEASGYRILEAARADEAHALLRQGELPDLVLLDLGLPDRPGLELARELRARHALRSVPIVALTGRSTEEERACLDAGCTAYLQKPVEPGELSRIVPDLLNGRPLLRRPHHHTRGRSSA